MLVVDADVVQVEQQLRHGELNCPSCGAVLAPWGHGRPREIRGDLASRLFLRPRRTRCSSCKVTHVLLAQVVVPRRVDAAEVIGSGLEIAALGMGHRSIAAVLGRAEGTVRGWLRRFRLRAEEVRRHFTVVLVAVADDPVMPDPAGSLVAAAVSAVVAAHRAATTKHPADLRKSPRTWRKTEQVRTADGTPIRSREQAEALMIARVEERRAFEATLRTTIEAAATAPAPKWTPAPSIIEPPEAAKPLAPAAVLAKWGDAVTYEEITPAEAEQAPASASAPAADVPGGAGTARAETDASSTPPARAVDVVSAPCAVDAWEGEGGAVPGVKPPQAEYWLPADEKSRAPAQWGSDRTRPDVRFIRAQDHVPRLGWAAAHLKATTAADADHLRNLSRCPAFERRGRGRNHSLGEQERCRDGPAVPQHALTW